jgi:hypothetical protein
VQVTASPFAVLLAVHLSTAVFGGFPNDNWWSIHELYVY